MSAATIRVNQTTRAMIKKRVKKFVWSDDEIAYLRENCDSMPYEDIGRKLGVSHTTVRLKALELGLSRPRYTKTVEWTDDRIAYLREHYADEPTTDISEHIGISQPTVKRKAEELGLRKSDTYDVRNYARRLVKNYKNKPTKKKDLYGRESKRDSALC